MPKIVGLRERRHQPYYDTLVRETNDEFAGTVVSQTTRLFNGTNLGQAYWTNMNAAGVFPSDNTYIVLSIRCYLFFKGTSALLMYARVSQQLYLTLFVGDKPQFQAPAWYFPQGGGVWIYDSATPIGSNGVPSQEAILKLAKPIPIPARQHFNVEAVFHDVGSQSVRTEYINSSTQIGEREIKVFIDGVHTRDVQ